jgi:serine/threonine protein kinase
LAADRELLRDVVDGVLKRAGSGADVAVECRGPWCQVRPRDVEPPAQGWKLHVSATLLSAPVVLSRVAARLVERRVWFKFARDLDALKQLLAAHCSRANSGKFVTVYPPNDEDARRLAEELDKVTFGLPGPAILSDRPLRPGSLVHYRYGAFHGQRVLGNDGFYETRLADPDGKIVRDDRLPRFAPPAFAVSPFDEPNEAAASGAVMLNDRYVVSQAITITNRGGIYLAHDQHAGATVVVKEGRPHVAADLTGTDARDQVDNEYRCLRRLDGLEVAPAPVDRFEQGGHVFVVEERVDGLTLHRSVANAAAAMGSDGFGSSVERTRKLAGQLVSLLGRIHGAGYVVRDLTPSNLMVREDGALLLVDLEHVAIPGDPVLSAGTAGYLAPELLDRPGGIMPAPDQSTDLFSLGAVVCFVAVGGELQVSHDQLDDLAAESPALAAVLPMVRGLTAPIGERWDLAACAAFLDRRAPEAPRRATEKVAFDELLEGCTALLLSTARDAGTDVPLWPISHQDEAPDPCAVSAGAAGPLGVLTALYRSRPSGQVADAMHAAVSWLRRRLEAENVWRPGLYFGRAGALWALYDAAHLVGDDDTARYVVDAARRLPFDWPSPDVTHGLAGCAMTLLHLGMDEQTTTVFDLLLAAERPGVEWPTLSTADSGLAGVNHYGFAHGIAGIGTALLYGSVALGRDELLESAGRIAAVFHADAVLDGDAAWWPCHRNRPDSARPRRPHWCSGSSGIGTFLGRYWLVSGDDMALSLAISSRCGRVSDPRDHRLDRLSRARRRRGVPARSGPADRRQPLPRPGHRARRAARPQSGAARRPPGGSRRRWPRRRHRHWLSGRGLRPARLPAPPAGRHPATLASRLDPRPPDRPEGGDHACPLTSGSSRRCRSSSRPTTALAGARTASRSSTTAAPTPSRAVGGAGTGAPHHTHEACQRRPRGDG